MKCSYFLLALSTLGGALSLPQLPKVTSLEKVSGRGLADTIIKLIIMAHQLKEKNQNAWDVSNDMCRLHISTYAGGHCHLDMECPGRSNSNLYIEPGPGPDWNVCEIGKQQYFHKDEFGDFSITFTKAGGIDGNTEDGLHHPVIRAANIDNWAPIDVQTFSDNTDSSGKICYQINNSLRDGKLLEWICGLPPIGSQWGDESNSAPVTAQNYAPGWCGIHFIDYQIPKGDSKYYAAVRIVDAKGVKIGEIGNSYSYGKDRAEVDGPIEIQSLLPKKLVYDRPVGGSSASPDDAPITFHYGDDTWDTNNPGRCGMGKYDSGHRDGDCGFTC